MWRVKDVERNWVGACLFKLCHLISKEGIINQITGTMATQKHVHWLWRCVMWSVQSFHKYVKAQTILERRHWWQQVHTWGVRKNCLRRFKLQRWRFIKVRRRLGRWYRSSPKKKKGGWPDPTPPAHTLFLHKTPLNSFILSFCDP